MSRTFVDLMCEVFPNISPETQVELHRLTRRKDQYYNWLFSLSHIANLSQGDAVREIPILSIGKNGKPTKSDLPALLLNNSCDMQVDQGGPRSECITVIPLYPFEDYTRHFAHLPDYKRDLKQNAITDKFFVGGLPGRGTEYVADFGMLSTISTQYLHHALSNGLIEKVASLSRNGYYYFLAKLTLHLMRPESTDVKREDLTKRKRSFCPTFLKKLFS